MNKINFDENNMSINDIIYLFVDGEATDTEKHTLFKALSEDTSLQNELQDALLLKKTAPFATDYIEPPAVLTGNIMKSIGFATAVGTATTLATGGMKGFWGSTLISGSIIKTITTGLVGALLAFSVMYFLPDRKNDTDAIVKSKATDNLPLNKNTQNINIAKDTVVKYIYINRQITQDTDLTKLNSEISEPGKITINENDKIKPDINYSEIPVNMIQFDAGSELLKPDIIENNGYDSRSNDFDSDKGLISIELSGLQKLALFPEREEFNLQETMNNTSFTAFLNLNKNHSIGLSIGRETFPIWVANDKGELGARNSITWYGINYRYDFGNVSEFIPLSPYMQLTGAATQYGPFTKGAIGLGWMPDSRVTFYIGYEYSMMIQRYQGNNEYNSKTGLIYSVNVNF